MTTRDKSWDFVKFVLMFFVVFGHICPADAAEWTPMTRIVGLFVMPSFFFVSGIFQSTITNFQELIGKFKKTFFRVFIPMMAWGTLYIILTILKLFPIPDISNRVSTIDYIYSIICFLKYSPYYIAGFYWFFTALLLCLLVGSCLSFLMNNRRDYGLLTLCLSPLFFCLLPKTIIELYHFSFIWPFYVMGMLYRFFKLNLNPHGKDQLYNCVFIVLLLVTICIGINYHPRDTFYYTSNLFVDTPLVFIIKRFLIYFIAVVSMLYWIRVLYKKYSKSKIVVKFSDYGRDTLFVYCSHMIFLEFLYKPIILPSIFHRNGQLLIVVCEHVTGILLSAILYAFLLYICFLFRKHQIVSKLFLGE